MGVGSMRRFPVTTDRVRAIAQNTFKEAVRNRAFKGLMLLALLFILSSIVLSELAVSDQAPRVLLDFGLFSISLFGVIIAIVMGVILVFKEIEKKTIYTILPKPVHRFEIILGKYLGMLLILLVEVGVLVGVWLLLLWARGVPPSVEILKALALSFMEIMLVTAVAILFSSFSSPVLSGIFAMAIFVVGRVIYIMDEMLLAHSSIFNTRAWLKPVGEVLVAIVPDLKTFDATAQVLLGVPIEGGYLLGALGYCLSYVTVFLALAILLFQRRDFT